MQTHRLFALCLCLTLCACPRPAPELELALLPSGDRVYVIERPDGFESLDLGLRVETREQSVPEALELRLSSARGEHLVHRYDRAALAAHRSDEHSGGSVVQLERLHLLVPASLALDHLELDLRVGGDAHARSSAPLVRYTQRNRYRLPLRGCWLVASGHDFGVEHRRHYSKSHFAWDLVKLDDADGVAAGKQRPEQYAAFGQAVLAPAAGRVVLAQAGHPDLTPGEAGAIDAANFILIDHGDGEQSKLAHLQQGSLRVSLGQEVEAGAELARVGNSGRSDAPHLHFHVQTTDFDKDGSVKRERPLPVQLSGYRSTSNLGVGVQVERGRPRRGEIVCAD